MADERDPKVSQRYRELGREEPSRELDQAILAAAHRAADTPHAPLVTPAGRHRWYFSLGAAAILVLAVAITVQVERQQPDPEAVTVIPAPPAGEGDFFYKGKEAPPPAMEQPRDARRAEPRRKKVDGPKPKPGVTGDPAPVQEAPKEFARDDAPAASPPAESAVQPRASGELARSERREAQQQQTGERDLDAASHVEAQPNPAPAPSSRPEKREQPAGAEAASPRTRTAPGTSRLGPQGLFSGDAQRLPAPQAAPAPQAKPPEGRVASAAILLSPERLLERIAELRGEGRHNEADQALAEFRERYPDYRISEEMLKKVERKK